jgi:nucleoside-diphosphate-sugar epimerase
MRILITGATGIFGPLLVQRLLDDGHHVAALVHSTPVPFEAVRRIPGDVTSRGDVENALEGIDCVCHLATVKGRRETFLAVNVGGLYHVLDSARTLHTPPHIILLSGDNVMPIFDHPTDGPIAEDHEYLFGDDEYGLSKILEETVANQYVKKYGLPVTILRSSWIMEGDRAAFMCHPKRGGWSKYLSDDMKERLDRGDSFRVVPHGADGVPLKRHVVDPRDLAGAFACVMGNNKTYGETYHIAGPAPFDYQELADFLTERDPQPVFPLSVPDAYSFEIDISKAISMGYAPRYTMIDTARRALDNA